MRELSGIVPAWEVCMPLVFALVMLPVIALVGFFVAVVRCDGTFAAALAGAIFIVVALGAFIGASRISREAQRPAH